MLSLSQTQSLSPKQDPSAAVPAPLAMALNQVHPRSSTSVTKYLLFFIYKTNARSPAEIDQLINIPIVNALLYFITHTRKSAL